jgi:uncharacterized protein (TIGR02444 family)
MASPLWSFTQNFYARPGVEQACLALQASGANVCAVLCGVWLGLEGVAFTDRRKEEIRQLATPWQDDVVQPLRKLRTHWKAKSAGDEQWMALREQVKGLELDAERELLNRLEGVAQGWPRQQALDGDAWLFGLAGDAANTHGNHDALQLLRVAAGFV